ncbi:hypothetical protein L6452_32779 [Arctium lappa]|uniref:Uncharacterized protein n=1 Tax=Arctium lappa TaxID=4217 RepID=A0ACB8Z4N7_ARCLA|nr:hypothetical protein L6452_32779 [Arctium lappa]
MILHRLHSETCSALEQRKSRHMISDYKNPLFIIFFFFFFFFFSQLLIGQTTQTHVKSIPISYPSMNHHHPPSRSFFKQIH